LNILLDLEVILARKGQWNICWVLSCLSIRALQRRSSGTSSSVLVIYDGGQIIQC